MSLNKNTYHEKEREIPVFGEFDVVVIGAGMAGIVAALASSRNGAKTFLVEKSGMLGGVATSGMMSSITNLFYDRNNRQIIKGIPEEIVERMVAAGVSSPNWRDSKVPQIPNDAEVLQIEAYKMLVESKVRFLLYTNVSDTITQDIEGENKILKGIVVENKTGRSAIYGKVFIDCTGDSTVAYLAGAPTLVDGKDGSSVMFEMGNVDIDELFRYYKNNRECFDERADIAISFEDFEENWVERGIFHTPHHGGDKNKILQDAIKNGMYWKEKGLAYNLDVFGLYGTKGNKKILINSNYFRTDSFSDAENLSISTLEGRIMSLYLAQLLIDNMPGFKNSFITRTAAEIGVRMSRYIDGEHMITNEEFVKPEIFDDAICFTPSLEDVERGYKVSDKSFGIPYGSILPKKVDNLLIGSGKSIATKPIIRWKALRGQVNTMLIGEAAGTAAAVTVANGATTKTIDVKKIQEPLKRNYIGD